MKHLKSISSFVMIGLIIITQFFIPIAVHADGDTTPVPTESAVIVTTPDPVDTVTVETGSPLPAEASDVTATPEPAESPILSETPGPITETPAEALETTPVPAESAEPAEVAQEPTVSEILQQIPGGTEVVVLDETSQQLPLATQGAEEIIVGSDPMWCPAGETPGGSGCTPSYATVTDLIYDYYGLWLKSGPGTVYFTPVYSTNDVVFDHNNPYLAYLTDLTLQGGWNGGTGSAFGLSGNSVFNVPIGVYNWQGNIVLNNITVQNTDASGGYAIELQQSIPATTEINDILINNNQRSGLNISNYGNTIINRTTVSNNTRVGADIGWGRIEINNSHFDNNRGAYGLLIISADDVIIRGSSFNKNLDHGADIVANNVEIMDSQFNQNITDVSYGGSIYAEGSANLDGVNASENGHHGVDITASDVTIRNSQFNQNYADFGYGVNVDSLGNVELDGVTASNNFVGTMLNANGNVTVRNSTFYKDNWDGLEIFTNQGSFDSVTLINNIFNFNNRNNSDGYGVWFVPDAYDWLDVLGNIFINNFAGLVAWTGSGNVNIAPDNKFSLNCVDIWTDDQFIPGTYCGNPIDPDTIPTLVPSDTVPPTVGVDYRGNYVLPLDCTIENPPPVPLPNGDLVEIFCPVSGEATIARTDNTTLPDSVPDGYSYASAFDVSIINKEKYVWQIDKGGFIRSSFTDQPLQNGNNYSILYWDSMLFENGQLIENPDGGEWLPLKDYMLDASGKTRVYRLHPENPDDPRRIYSGVRLVEDHVTVDTNFPGIFVLVQY